MPAFQAARQLLCDRFEPAPRPFFDAMILLGIGLHALGGIAAASCYISQKGASKWSWQTYWLVFCLVAWFIMPLGISAFTVPDLGAVLREAPRDVVLKVFFYGALYGFGGMAFALAIRCIGFSMTYGMAIGISAVFGTVVPQVLDGTLVSNFQKPVRLKNYEGSHN